MWLKILDRKNWSDQKISVAKKKQLTSILMNEIGKFEWTLT